MSEQGGGMGGHVRLAFAHRHAHEGRSPGRLAAGARSKERPPAFSGGLLLAGQKPIFEFRSKNLAKMGQQIPRGNLLAVLRGYFKHGFSQPHNRRRYKLLSWFRNLPGLSNHCLNGRRHQRKCLPTQSQNGTLLTGTFNPMNALALE